MISTQIQDLLRRNVLRSLLMAMELLLFACSELLWSQNVRHVTKATLLVPMRDGIKLATDVYTVVPGAKRPVLLMRTPYNKTGVQSTAELYADSGYTVVVQDCRGRFASEGSFIPYNNEGQDGFDTLEWISKQPW